MTIYCYDENLKKSNESVLTFIYSYNSPDITITTPNNQEFKKNDGRSFNLEGTITDEDKDGTIRIYYQIDEGEINNIINITLDQTASETFDINITFPSDLSESNSHTIKVWATDETGKSSATARLNFSYTFNNPIINITNDIKNSYTKNTDDNITINGTVSNLNGKGRIDIYYMFDNETKINITSITVTNSTENYEFNFTAHIPSDFNESNNHAIKIWANDYLNKTSEIITRNFSYVYNDPVFKLYNFTENKFMRGSPLDINFTYEHPDNTALKSLNISFDGNQSMSLIINISDITENIPEKVSKRINIPNEIAFGKYNIYLYGCDVHGHCSISDKIEFKVVEFLYSFPNLTMTKFGDSIYKRKVSNTFDVEGTVVDMDGEGIVNISCFIDDLLIDSQKIEIKNISEHNFSFKLKFPANLNESSHTFFIIAEDESGKKSENYTSRFNYEFNSPVLEIQSKTKQTLIGDMISNFFLRGIVRDADGQGTITIKYILDEEPPVNFGSVTLRDSVSAEFYDKFNFTKVIETGTHSLDIYAVDDDGKESNHQQMRFTFLYITEKLIMRNKAKRCYSTPILSLIPMLQSKKSF
ncbi:hypothetical protein TVAG_254990 [Trichomonas vaginalis G3]|uniref:Bap-like n=1 Tax=Trichomonas vaginalis (strain ATCC PRA-98 / G3) TaxID=412133 RepID=A2EXP1_TRIV3|nr:immunoglobulins domain-containing protein [Trichomonas vaginalis G3]EAY02598.1 hypothetical protein TVAG_254990 [Trichomonas vaginalis G3]KAI5511735.1 immunoglobulins domain-containing protein [Trichomonas vaginalis G3]|eukprot:XP_001314821.1 hypothetical protein [Trichomonas vaginalis G3]